VCVHVMGKWFENLFVYMYIYCIDTTYRGGGRGGGIHKCNLLLPYRAAGQHYTRKYSKETKYTSHLHSFLPMQVH